jgi:lysylphosphatidylglycerol synthase-like protein
VTLSRARRTGAFGALMALAGAGPFAWLVWRVGPGEIWAGFGKIGWWLAAIVALGGLRFAARAVAWCLCFDPPARLRFSDAFAAVLSGDALGNVIPLGPLISEPAKAAFVRGRTDLVQAVTALAIENVFYTLSVAAMIAAATLAMLFSFELPAGLRQSSEIALAIVVAMFAIAMVALWRRPTVISRALGRFGGRRVARLQHLEQQIYSFASRRTSVMLPLLLSEAAFHVLGVIEVHLTLLLLLPSPPALMTSFILEGANRLINVLFKFIPLRIGVDEAGSEGLANAILGLPFGAGTTLAIVRRARVLFWVFAGSALLVRQGLSAKRILEDSQLAGSAAPLDT